MIRNYFQALLILVLLPSQVHAQDSLRSSDAYRFLDASAYTFSQPTRWKKKDFLRVGGLVAGMALISVIDEPINHFWQKQDNQFLDKVERVGFHYGKPYSAVFFSGAFYLSGIAFKSNRSRELGIRLGTVLLTSSTLSAASKTVFGRARPRMNLGAYDFNFFNLEPDYHSFPSGHASVALAISLTVASYTKSPWVKVIFYSLAGSTVVARMYTRAHWASDLVYGGTLAWACSTVANRRLNNNEYRIQREKRKDAPSLSLLPLQNGVRLTIRL